MKTKLPAKPYRPRRPDSHLRPNKKKTPGSTIYNADLRQNQQKRQAGVLKFFKDTPLQKFRQLRKKFYSLTKIYNKFTHHSSINQKSLNNINELEIIEGKWDELKVRDLFDSIYEADAVVLRLYENLNPEIPQVISKINLPQLKKLYLDSNNITSVEILCCTYFPYLEQIGIQHNLICSVLPIRRLHCINLKVIYLENNYINDISCLSQLLSHKLMYLHLMDYDYPGKNASIDIYQLLKMNSMQIKKISLDNRHQIESQKLITSFIKKFPLIQFSD